jgi:hypothetical protein
MNQEFKLIKEDYRHINIENIDYKIRIYLDSPIKVSIGVYYKKSGIRRTYYKSKYVNFIPQKYRETIDSFLVLHKLTWGN